MLPLLRTIRALLTLEVVISSQYTLTGPSVRVKLPLCADNTRRLTSAFREPSPSEKRVALHKVGVSESPESGESG